MYPQNFGKRWVFYEHIFFKSINQSNHMLVLWIGAPLVLTVILIGLFVSYLYIKKSLAARHTYQLKELYLKKESVIPLHVFRLAQILELHVQDITQYDNLVHILTKTMDRKFHSVYLQLEQDYPFFTPGSEIETTQSLKQQKMTFTSSLIQILERANFHPISKEELEFGENESFELTFPLDAEWYKLDESLFADLKNDSFVGLEFENKIWIYCRGITETKKQDRFIWEKLDNLILDWLRIPNRLYTWLCAKDRVLSTKTKSDKNMVRITRVPIQPSIFNILTKYTVKEPTYNDIVVIYRDKNAVNKNEINVKLFNKIPMADLELCFPSCKPSIRPFDVVQMTITFLIANFTLLWKIVSEDAANWAIMVSISSFLLVFVQIFIYLGKYAGEYRNLMIQMLSRKV
jgi:hypothetical protein